MKLSEIYKIIDSKFILAEQEKWDNSGLQVGDMNSEISKAVIALDLDENVIDLAIKKNAELILTHHPFLFSSIKSVDLSTFHGNMIKKLIKNDISLLSLHTSLDMAKYGIGYEFAKLFDTDDFVPLHTNYVENGISFGYGGVINLKESLSFEEFAKKLKEKSEFNALKIYGDFSGKSIKKIAFCGGSGSDFIDDALSNNCDVYITGDIKYHDAQYAIRNNLNIIDAGHFYTENIILNSLKSALEDVLDEVSCYTKNTVSEYYL